MAKTKTENKAETEMKLLDNEISKSNIHKRKGHITEYREVSQGSVTS